MFRSSFLRPCEPFRQHIGVLIFEFSQFHQRDFARGGDFVAALDAFLGELPRDWQYAVEIRNRNFLHPEYFAMLRGHGVAHVFNSWSRMPPVSEQMALPDSITTDFCAARFLSRPVAPTSRRSRSSVPTRKPKRKIPPRGRLAGS
jgi:uncharacterized protein YecE (DUF72 family)